MALARLLRATGAVDGDFAVNSGDGSDVVSVHRECGIEIGENKVWYVDEDGDNRLGFCC